VHLLATSSASLDDLAEPIDLRQAPAEMVALSFTDSDLAGLAAAWEAGRDRLPSLRVANLRDLRHPMSVDLWVDSVAAHAKIILVRILGGHDWWRYGCDRLAALAREKGIALALLPGEDRAADERLAEASTLPAEELAALLAYFREGGPDNMAALLARLASHAGREAEAPPARPLPKEGYYWPGRGIVGAAEMEALLSLAAYSYEHPADPFPEFVEGAPTFHAEELGHPLIPVAKCVRNTVSIRGETRALLISGSNMSGKSTLMRSVGINTVLAMAGAPVRARCLRLTPLRVGASILVNDSLQEGSSRFYAEITRLRRICDLAEQHPPVLFLLDELLQGTNSKDRLTGAEAVVRELIDSGAIGIVSTHDLALTDMQHSGKGRLQNMHLQDEIEDGKMKFDFKLRPGVVTKSNGVELMRLIGLKV